MKAKKKSRRARTHFVPRAVYRTAFAGVVPLCVAGLACGGSTTSTGTDGGGDDSGQDAYINGAVGCAGFCVAAVGFDAGMDAPTDGASADAPADARADGPPVFAVACSLALCGVGVAAFDGSNGDGG